jgi:hypothetical protein
VTGAFEWFDGDGCDDDDLGGRQRLGLALRKDEIWATGQFLGRPPGCLNLLG